MRASACARLLLVAALAHAAAAAPVVRHDNSPICVTTFPACQAKCRGQEYFFMCSAGSGPEGGPYVICRCAVPAAPVGGPVQSEWG
jgi:hypothetical protein